MFDELIDLVLYVMRHPMLWLPAAAIVHMVVRVAYIEFTRVQVAQFVAANHGDLPPLNVLMVQGHSALFLSMVLQHYRKRVT